MKTDLLVIHCDQQVEGVWEWENRRSMATACMPAFRGEQEKGLCSCRNLLCCDHL